MSRVLLEQITAHSAGQEVPHLLRNPKVHYGVRKSPPLVPILSQTNPVHKLKQQFPEIQFLNYPNIYA
jgi:hypothetical protein